MDEPPKRKRPPPKPKKPPKKTSYDVWGLIKHAQVARVLLINRVTTAEFYIAARLCQEHLPPSTFETLEAETCRQKPKEKPVKFGVYQVVRRLQRKGLLTTTPEKGAAKATRVDITQQGWIWYLLLLAEMERPIREVTVLTYRKKLKFNHGNHGKRAGAAMRKVRFSALARKRGLSIWERSALASLPQWQRLENGVPKSTEADSTSQTSAGPGQQ